MFLFPFLVIKCSSLAQAINTSVPFHEKKIANKQIRCNINLFFFSFSCTTTLSVLFFSSLTSFFHTISHKLRLSLKKGEKMIQDSLIHLALFIWSRKEDKLFTLRISRRLPTPPKHLRNASPIITTFFLQTISFSLKFDWDIGFHLSQWEDTELRFSSGNWKF